MFKNKNVLKAKLNKSDEQQTIRNEYKLHHISYFKDLSLIEQRIHIDTSLN